MNVFEMYWTFVPHHINSLLYLTFGVSKVHEVMTYRKCLFSIRPITEIKPHIVCLKHVLFLFRYSKPQCFTHNTWRISGKQRAIFKQADHTSNILVYAHRNRLHQYIYVPHKMKQYEVVTRYDRGGLRNFCLSSYLLQFPLRLCLRACMSRHECNAFYFCLLTISYV